MVIQRHGKEKKRMLVISSSHKIVILHYAQPVSYAKPLSFASKEGRILCEAKLRILLAKPSTYLLEGTKMTYNF